MITNDMLWDFADDLLSDAERKIVLTAVEKDENLKAELETIFAEKYLFSQMPLEKVNADFSKNILLQWQKEQAQNVEIVLPKNRLMYYLSASFLVLCVVLFYFTFSTPTQAPLNLPLLKIPDFNFGNTQFMQFSLLIFSIIFAKFIEKIVIFYRFKTNFG